MDKRTAQKDTIIDTTSDSQVKSNFPYRWSPASLTFNNYFYLFSYLYITRITINNNAPHLKITKEPKQKSRIGAASNEITGWVGGGGGGVGGGASTSCGRPIPSPLVLPWFHKPIFEPLSYVYNPLTCCFKSYHRFKKKHI